ncbi:MAG TPA: hypothetical protein VKD71_12495 [Gemmataceae bacterium]|nr:hypothetical protein [Gemmataceae bacterium]
MSDTFEQTVHPEGKRDLHNEATAQVPEMHADESVGTNGTHEPTWRTAAGRKGAKRIHELIEAGKRYEEEHGLKSGRQRLRQLIELGKLYEEEHQLRPAGRKRRRQRLSRTERDEVVSTLLECLVRMAKPSFRKELTRLAEALNPEKSQAA